MKASEYYKKKAVNIVNQKWNPDGTVEITIYKQGWKKSYKCKIRKHNQLGEQILEDEEIDE